MNDTGTGESRIVVPRYLGINEFYATGGGIDIGHSSIRAGKATFYSAIFKPHVIVRIEIKDSAQCIAAIS